MASGKKQKSGVLPGMERKSCKALDKAAEEYADIRDERMALTKKEVEAKQKLVDIVHANVDQFEPGEDGIKVYSTDDITIELSTGKEKIKVRVGAEDDEEEEED